jgi:ankyrin repeat protein
MVNEWTIDINAIDDSRKTALHHAEKGGHEGVVQLLREYGVDRGVKDNNGRTAQRLAAEMM